MPRFRLPALVAAVLCLTGTPPHAQPADATSGRIIAERWCASCHVVADNQARAGDGAPTMLTIARNAALTDDILLQKITQPHPPMPNIAIGKKEAADIMAYLKTLR